MSELSDRLNDIAGLTLTSVHMGLEEHLHEKTEFLQASKTYYDNWMVTITYKGESYSTKYITGSGFRKPIHGVKSEYRGYYKASTGDLKQFKEACDAGWLKATLPALDDVMYALLVDASCVEGTFEDYCSEFGIDSDSRKALATYLECQTARTAMIKMLGPVLFTELSSLEH